jgi:hypothetical protein
MFILCCAPRRGSFTNLQRMQNAAQGRFKDALHELERLQAARPAQPVEEEPTFVLEENAVGFVPSSEVEQALPPADAGEAGTPVEPAESAENAPAAPAPGFVSSTNPEPTFSHSAVPSPQSPDTWFDTTTIWAHPPYGDDSQSFCD